MKRNKKNLKSALADLGEWHHSIDLGFGIRTAPQHTTYDPMDRWTILEANLPDDLAGASVLDLGANSGFMAVKMKQLGAERVVAVDVAEHSLKQARFLANWFDVNIETVCSDVHVFCLTCQERFDYVIFMGLFYHLKYPVLVLDRAAEMARQKLFFQTVLFDSDEEQIEVPEDLTWGDRSGIMKEAAYPCMRFIEHRFETDGSNWWICNHSGVRALLRNAGLDFDYVPETELFICTPKSVRGKIRIADGAVFPRYGKEDLTFPMDSDQRISR